MTEDYTLAAGTHASPDEGRCAMEWVSHLAGEPHSDAPVCVSPVLRAVCVTLNDGLPDGPRQRLRPALARTIGTAADGRDRARAWSALDWLARTYAPAWLTLAGLTDEASTLARRPAILDAAGLRAALPRLRHARRTVRDARTVAFGAGGVHVAARVAAAAAARSGVDAAWPCAGAAAWAGARIAVDDAAADHVRSGARAIAGDAAAIAMLGSAADDVCGPAEGRGALATAIAPTREALEASAIALLSRMLPGEMLAVPPRAAGAATGAELTVAAA